MIGRVGLVPHELLHRVRLDAPKLLRCAFELRQAAVGALLLGGETRAARFQHGLVRLSGGGADGDRLALRRSSGAGGGGGGGEEGEVVERLGVGGGLLRRLERHAALEQLSGGDAERAQRIDDGFGAERREADGGLVDGRRRPDAEMVRERFGLRGGEGERRRHVGFEHHARVAAQHVDERVHQRDVGRRSGAGVEAKRRVERHRHRRGRRLELLTVRVGNS